MNKGGNFLLSLMTLEISLSVPQKLPFMALAGTGCRKCRKFRRKRQKGRKDIWLQSTRIWRPGWQICSPPM